MTQHEMTPDQVLDNLKRTINANFQNHFRPMAMPRDSFTSDNPDAIEPYDLDRAKNPEINIQLREALNGPVRRSHKEIADWFGVDVADVDQVAREMLDEDPELLSLIGGAA